MFENKRFFLLLLLAMAAASVRAFSPGDMVSIIGQVDENAQQVGSNKVSFSYDDVDMLLVYDVHANRMRLMAAIEGNITTPQLVASLQANFHTTLDVRYAASGNVMWAAYLHPLSTLTAQQFRDAISQVASAQKTFGTTYSAGSWTFAGSVVARSPIQDDATAATSDETDEEEIDVE